MINLKLVGQLQMSIKQINWHQIPKTIVKFRKAEKASKSKSSHFKSLGDSYVTVDDLVRSQRQPQLEALITLQGKSKTPKPNDICIACGGQDIGGKIVSRSKQEETAASSTRDSHLQPSVLPAKKSVPSATGKPAEGKCQVNTSTNSKLNMITALSVQTYRHF